MPAPPPKSLTTSHSQSFISGLKALAQDAPLSQLIQPALGGELEQRKRYAASQPLPPRGDSDKDTVADLHGGLVDVFASGLTEVLKVRPRSDPDEAHYAFETPERFNIAQGQSAVCPDLDTFKKRFLIFSEGALSQLKDWSNVIVAGGSVLAALAPLPVQATTSRRQIRKFYHEEAYASSDVDLFLYGLTPEQAERKMVEIYEAVLDSVTSDVTCVRMKNAVSIVANFPVKHVQIVLRIYRSPAEVLIGFDVDSCSVAFDGDRVWATPRALIALMERCNRVDISRRSPSYETRLTKYALRGFQVYVNDLDRKRIDPTIYERSAIRVQGLARLLLLEKLTSAQQRNDYIDKRRQRSCRPSRKQTIYYPNRSDLKAAAEILPSSDYDSILHVPYGPKYTPQKISKTIYKTDLGLNSEFNPKNRGRRLHRHAAFFGTMQEVLDDQCQLCPEPLNEEEEQQHEQECQRYVKGRISFLTVDPGQQLATGSFQPITTGDWSELAYLEENHALFQAVADNDREALLHVLSTMSLELINRRDYVGRTALHLAVMTNCVDLAIDLIAAGARISPRLSNGQTALHLASAIGSVELVTKILEVDVKNKSELGSEDVGHVEKSKESTEADNVSDDEDEDEDDSMDSAEEQDYEEARSVVPPTKAQDEAQSKQVQEDKGLDIDLELPDILEDIHQAAWDEPLQPIHLAVISGSIRVVELLVQHGASVSAAAEWVKPSNDYDYCSSKAAKSFTAFPLTCAFMIPKDDVAIAMIEYLVANGATSADADKYFRTVAARALFSGRPSLLKVLLDRDPKIHTILKTAFPLSKSWNQEVTLPVSLPLVKRDPASLLLSLAKGARLELEKQDYTLVLSQLSKRSRGIHATYQEVFQPIEVSLAMVTPEWKLLADLGVPLPPALLADLGSNWGYSGPPTTLYDFLVKTISTHSDGCADVSVLNEKAKKEFLSEKASCSVQQEPLDWLNVLALTIDSQHQNSDPSKDSSESEHLNESKESFWKEFFNEVLAHLKTHQPEVCTSWNDLEHQVKTDLKTFSKRRVYPVEVWTPHRLTFVNLSSTWRVVEASVSSGFLKLYEAIAKGDSESVVGIVESEGLMLDHATRDGFVTPFMMAVIAERTELLPLLLKIAEKQYRADPEADIRREAEDWWMRSHDEDNYSDYGSDYEAEYEMEIRYLREVEAMVGKAAVGDVTLVPQHVTTTTHPLSILAKCAYLDLTKLLPPEKASLFKKPSQNNQAIAEVSALDLLCVRGDVKGVRAFLKLLTAYPDYQKHCRLSSIDAADYAIAADSPEVLKLLIQEFGVGIDTQALEGKYKLDEDRTSGKRATSQRYKGLLVSGKREKQPDNRNSSTDDSDTGPSLLEVAARCHAPKVFAYLATNEAVAAVETFLKRFPTDPRAVLLSQVPNLAEEVTGQLTRCEDLAHQIAYFVPNKTAICKWLLNQSSWPGLFNQNHLQQKMTLEPFHTPLMAFAASSSEEVDFVDFLLAQGVDPSATDHRGCNVLHLLARSHRRKSAATLQHVLGALDPDVLAALLRRRTSFGLTPLHVAIQRGREESVAPILEATVRLAKDALRIRSSFGAVPLHDAITSSRFETVKVLVDADPSTLNLETADGLVAAEMVARIWGTATFSRMRMQSELSLDVDHYLPFLYQLQTKKATEFFKGDCENRSLLSDAQMAAVDSVVQDILAPSSGCSDKLKEAVKAYRSRLGHHQTQVRSLGVKPQSSGDTDPYEMIVSASEANSGKRERVSLLDVQTAVESTMRTLRRKTDEDSKKKEEENKKKRSTIYKHHADVFSLDP